MKKFTKLGSFALLTALTVSNLGTGILHAQTDSGGTIQTQASISIEDGVITPTLPSEALTFPSYTFSFRDYFGETDYSQSAQTGQLSFSVDDQRSLNGLTDGWKVTAKLSKFETEGTGQTLGTGTFITLSGGAPILAEDAYNGITPPTVLASDIELKNEADTLIWSAKRGTDNLEAVGVDKWDLNYLNENIKLTIPAKELVSGNHTAKITWTFSDTITDGNE